jgi:hypothetical protein
MSQMGSADTRDVSVGNGFAAGTLTFALGYVVTYAWQADSVRESLQAYNALVQFFGGDPVPTWKAVGWLLYNAHYVAVSYPTFGAGRASRNLVADGNAPALLLLLPPVLLMAAGVVLARAAESDGLGPCARSGASVTLGYVVFAVLGLVAFQYSVGDATMHPEYVLGALLAGVVYPLVFGAAGGVLGAATSS